MPQSANDNATRAGDSEAPLPWDSAEAGEASSPQPRPKRPVGRRAAQQQAAEPSRSDDDGEPVGPPPRGGGWTIPVLCVGIALVACCVLIPQADANRRLAYEQRKLRMDLDSIEKQVTVNDEFLKKINDDPNLAERLAQRQMREIRQGTRVLKLKKLNGEGNPMSPFQLVNVSPPPPLPPYKPIRGPLADLCYNPHSRLYLTGLGLTLIAFGLVLGVEPKK